jgi:type II secretory pathway pseudopilin PulG
MRRLHGFTYIGLLIAVALIGIGLAAVAEVWTTAAKRERERELLFVGGQFRQAIGSYFEASPGLKQYPQRLEDLLEDRRFPVIRRHLRKIYLDPITGKSDWGLVIQGDKIFGVYSQSADKPLKTDNFDPLDSSFAGSNAYSEWKFVYTPSAPPSEAPAGAAPGTQLPQASAFPGGQPGPAQGQSATPPSGKMP